MKEWIISLIILVGMVLIIVGVGFIVLKNLNEQAFEYEKKCSRVSMNEFEDNCMCPCTEPNWIEKKLNLYSTCDGWIVKKNESCLNGIEFARG